MSDRSRIPVVCLCGTYLRAHPQTIGKVMACPSCHGTVEIRQSNAEDGKLSTLYLKAKRIPGRGKARWKLPDGFEGFVEQIALKSFESRGWQGVWGENSLWECLMALLFWDVFFAPVEGMWEPLFAQGSPLWEQDMPRDWGGHEFYENRKAMIVERLTYLRSADLHDEITKVYSASHGRRCRPIWDWDKFSSDQLASIATAIPRPEFLEILTRLLKDHYQNRSGLTDLFLWKESSCAFVEVKGPRDKLSVQQLHWLYFLNDLRFRTFVLRVEKQ